VEFFVDVDEQLQQQ